ncbi:hypothetical protein KSP40_PGU022390 [Platanthera guangdongensis]|uniref:Uncharacterized protein n=1 Tax=Platanthera guangdongensis TaxID=2320717 RepID=A0ABR2MM40_9ASPA
MARIPPDPAILRHRACPNQPQWCGDHHGVLMLPARRADRLRSICLQEYICLCGDSGRDRLLQQPCLHACWDGE